MSISLTSTPAKTLDSGNVQRWVSMFNPLLFTFTASGSPAPTKIKIELYDNTTSPATQINTNELVFDFSTSDTFTFDASPYLKAYIERTFWDDFSSQSNDSSAYVPFSIKYFEEPDGSPTSEADSETFYGLYSANQIGDKYGQNAGNLLPDIGTGSPFDVNKGKFLNAPISKVKAYKNYPFALSLINSDSLQLEQLTKTYEGVESIESIIGNDNQVRILPIDLSSYTAGSKLGVKMEALSSELDIFLSLWNTANTSTGSSNSDQITLPLISSGTYDFVVDWGDGSRDTITSYDQSEVTHTYSGGGGTKQIQIIGTIQGWQFNNTGDRNKLLTITNWGSLDINNDSAFYGCSNLSLTSVSGTPTLSNTNSLSGIFRTCSSLITINNVENWDISACNNLSNAFLSASNFNDSNISEWDTSNISNFVNCFLACPNFDQDLSNWSLISATNLSSMLSSCTSYNNGGQPLNFSNYPVSNCNFSSMFSSCPSFNQNLSSWNVSSATTMASMFEDATTFNQDLGAWDLTSLTTAANMFDSSGMSQTNYDATLDGWELPEAGTTPDGITLGASGVNYTTGLASRAALIADHSWTFVGDIAN